ncbi:MAG: alanine racemase [Clostridia bacterium]|nr:alanine racemase [Clostridia bacterium]
MVRPVWAEIDLQAIKHNVGELKRILSCGTDLMAVVKANAYGHGAVPAARAALAGGATWLGVATLAEAVELRQSGLTAPILILGYTPPEDADEVIARDLDQAVFTLEQAQTLAAAAAAQGKRARLHLKVDTGMGRLGVFPDARGLEVARAIAGLPQVQLRGLFTHFATADAGDKTFAREQFRLFREFNRSLLAAGLRIPWLHVSNSAALIDMPETHLNLVRPGIAIYGHYPSPQVRQDLVNLKPAMSFKARIVYIKEVPPGSSISYGRTFYTTRLSRIATLPLGYADGYSRLLSNKAAVLVRGRRAPVVGRICMDYCMIDVTDIPGVEIGDEAVLFGHQDGACLTLEEVAAWLGTITYEVLCMVGNRVPRRYLGPCFG